MADTILSVNNVSGGYGEKQILDDINFDIKPGEIRVILGTSGCGKSTLMRNVLQLYRPWEGQVIFLGNDLTQLEDEAYENEILKMGVTYQGGALIGSITVGENVALPLAQHTKLSIGEQFSLVRRSLEMVHLTGTENLMPAQLSGGMLKRAALARAIILDPKLIICDEPTAGLDPVTMKTIDDLILELRDTLNTAFAIVTHEINSIKRISDSITFLEEGKVVFSGTLEKAFTSEIKTVQDFFENINPID